MDVHERRGGARPAKEVACSGDAPSVAAVAAFLEIGHRLDVLEVIASGQVFDVADVAGRAGLPSGAAGRYVAAIEAAGLVERVPGEGGGFRTVPRFPLLAHRAGYVAWASGANRPLIEHARDFLTDPGAAAARHPRDDRMVGDSSQWMAWLALYPSVVNVMLVARPRKVVDLGSGGGRLLVDALTRMPDCVGVGVDHDPGTCGAAERAAERAGVAARLTVHRRPIESLVDDPSPLSGSDVVHAGLVLHELVEDGCGSLDAVLAACHGELRPGGMLVVAETVPAPHDDDERAFGALIDFYRTVLLQRRLLTEEDWCDRLRTAGFSAVEILPVGFPAGRLVVGHR